MSKPRITDYPTELKQEAAGLREFVDAASLARLAPSRPDRTVADLISELVRLYRWAADALAVDPGESDVPEPAVEHNGAEGVLEAFDESLGLAVDALESRPPDAPAWNWAPVPRKAEFWHRRVTVASALARWDVQMAVGATGPVPAAIACEAIAEVFEAHLPAGRRRGRHDQAHGLVQLCAQDADATWFVRLREGRATLPDRPGRGVELRARAAGSASDIALALWGRLPFGICEIAGDEALLQALRAE